MFDKMVADEVGEGEDQGGEVGEDDLLLDLEEVKNSTNNIQPLHSQQRRPREDQQQNSLPENGACFAPQVKKEETKEEDIKKEMKEHKYKKIAVSLKDHEAWNRRAP